ncbi:hypothetical protein [Streptomyces sp. NPDC002250]|uniref:hypothetical protein n=1 Tax=Streptomyces sp. NPDC002250 TaxID=3364641 RepID=UPI0036CC38C5
MDETRAGRTVSLLTSLASQTALLTALMFYFGWVSTRAAYRYFRVDTSLLDFSTVDYMVRGVRLAYPTLLTLGLMAFFCVHAHHVVRERTESDPELTRRLGRLLEHAGFGGVLAGLALVALLDSGSGTEPPPGPALMTAGFAAVAYGDALGPGRPRARSPLWRGMAIVLALLSLFAAAAGYAEIVGRRTARTTLAELPDAPDVVVYSKDDLLPDPVPGVRSVRLKRPARAEPLYRYRVTGLKLLIRSGGRCFLVPEDWRPERGPVIVLPSDPKDLEMRMEFREAGS